MMLRPDPTGFTASTTILGELAHQLRPCASCSSAQSDDQLDTVGVMNGSVLIEALSDSVSLSPTEAPRYVREILAMRDPHHADLYEKAARGLSRPQRSVASTLGIFAVLPGTLKARILDLIAQSVRPKRPWQVQRELGLPRAPSAELSKLVTRGYFVSVRAGCYGIPGRDDGGGVVAKSNHA
jgi:hypothetical protein